MELNKKNWFAMYYNWMNGEYPKDVCSFFWGTLSAIVFGAVRIPGRLVLFDEGRGKYHFFLQSVYGFVVLVAYAFISIGGESLLGKFGYEFSNLFWLLTGGFLLGVVGILVFLGICGLIIWICKLLAERNKKRPKSYKIEEQKPSFMDKAIDFIAAIKGKYCTQITWK